VASLEELLSVPAIAQHASQGARTTDPASGT